MHKLRKEGLKALDWKERRNSFRSDRWSRINISSIYIYREKIFCDVFRDTDNHVSLLHSSFPYITMTNQTSFQIPFDKLPLIWYIRLLFDVEREKYITFFFLRHFEIYIYKRENIIYV